MTAWRSTTLGLAEKHCPKVLDYLDAGLPYSREVFHVGTAAHACLEDIGKASATAGRWLDQEEAETVSRKTCEGLIANGRDFEGEMEPPLPSAQVWRGRDLALRYQTDKPLSPKYEYEAVLAVTRDFLPCPAAGEPWLKARIDAYGTALPSEEWWEDDDGSAGPVLEITDYKSAWSTDADDLYTIQRKIQAVVGWAHWQEGHDAVRLVLVNFRAGRSFETTIFPRTPEGAAVMERWRRDIASEIAAREKERIASPGACCFGCPYLQQCPEALAYLPRVFGAADPIEAAHSYAVNLAVASSIEPGLRRATEEEPIPVAGGYVGTEISWERRLNDTAYDRLAEYWLGQAKPASFEQLKAMLPGLLRVAKIGTGQADALLKNYLKRKPELIAQREAIMAAITGQRIRTSWGVHKGEPGAGSAEPEDNLEELLKASIAMVQSEESDGAGRGDPPPASPTPEP